MFSLIVAVGKNNEIGKNNQLLWHISEDLKNFKRITTGKTVIMGRNTYESIGRPLPNRVNIVLSRNFLEAEKNMKTKLQSWNFLMIFRRLLKNIKICQRKFLLLGEARFIKSRLNLGL